MRFFLTITGLLLLGCGVVLPMTVSAQQSSSSTSASSLTEPQRRGESMFMQNCSFCHLPLKENTKSTTGGTTIGTLLNGLFRSATPDREKIFREFILQGTDKMPGFRYMLEPKELDDLMAYLKTL